MTARDDYPERSDREVRQMFDEIDRLREALRDLARLALQGDHRDVEMYVHRLAHRHRKDSLGARLAAIDRVPGVSLRSGGPASNQADPEAVRTLLSDELLADIRRLVGSVQSTYASMHSAVVASDRVLAWLDAEQ